MSNNHTHLTVNIPLWTDALRLAKVALEAHPEAITITFVASAPLSAEMHESLINAVSFEKILAAQPLSVPETLTKHGADQQPVLITHIDAEVSLFKAQPLRDYLEAIESQLGPDVSPSDISIYLNQLGYSSVSVAVTGIENLPESTSSHFQPPREWDAYIAHVNNKWNAHKKDSQSFFASLARAHTKPRVLIDARTTPQMMNGTARTVTSFLSALDKQLASQQLDWDVTVLIPEESRVALGINSARFTWIVPEVKLNQAFDMGISLTPVSTVEQCLSIASLCARWLVLHLDIIALRALQFLSQNTLAASAVEFYLDHADSIVFISEFSRTDAENYFGEIDNLNSRSVVIHLGTHFDAVSLLAVDKETPEKDEQPHVLVLGNSYPHKQVRQIVKALTAAGVSVSTLNHTYVAGQEPVALAGPVSDEQLQYMMVNATALVFPAMYEGFGLPIVEAAALGKKLVVWDTAISREVSHKLNLEDSVVYCSSTKDVVAAVKALMASTSTSTPVNEIRTMTDFNTDFIEHIDKLLHTPINQRLLKDRLKLINILSAVTTSAEARVTASIAQQHWRNRLARKFK